MAGLAKVFLLLTAMMFTAEAGIIEVAHLTYRDPFAPYLGLMPGQSIDGLKDYPCRFISAKTTNRQIGMCNFPSNLGPFDQITLTAYDHIIEQTDMQAQADRLHYGDLTLCWGKPSLETSGSQAANWVVRWGREVSTDVTLENGTADMSDFLPVHYLNIEGEWLPCHSA